MKKTILHIIDNLGRGGAETMLVTVTKNLPGYNNIIVTLYPENEFGEELQCDQLICLNLSSPLMIPIAAMRLRSIIREYRVDLVHSHLFWSTVVARLGVPRNVPLLTTIHAFVQSSIEYKPWRMRMIEKATYLFKKSTIIAVAKGALEEYFKFIKVKPHNSYALYTFVNTAVFKTVVETQKQQPSTVFKVVTVGNLKAQKNHQFLAKAFELLKDENIQLDIYGKGPLENSLQQMIDEQQLNIHLKGQVADIQNKIGEYDLFVMSSLYEGFALSVLEAMALGRPLLLSDVPSFREQCADTAIYFSLDDVHDFVEKIKTLKRDTILLQSMGNAAQERVLQHFTLQQHLAQLQNIYSSSIEEKLLTKLYATTIS